MLSKHRSKKTSEEGTWVDDKDSPNCLQCDKPFTLTRRRHHCRRCGKLVCGSCSNKKLYLDISRSGKAKRVCTGCYDHVMGDGETKDAVDEAADALEKATIKEGEEGEGESGGAETGAGAGAGGEDGKEEDAAKDKPSFLRMEIPEVPAEEAVENVKSVEFDGAWSGLLQFLVVDIGSQRKDAVVSGMAVGSFVPRGGGGGGAARGGRGRGRGRGGKRRRSSINTAHVREGSKLRVTLTLERKGASYFNGTLSSFGQFGKDAKITGSLQKSTGKVSMQISATNFGTTTSFNLTGVVTADKELVGTFSGCEISKSAGSVSGLFRASPDGGEEDSDSD